MYNRNRYNAQSNQGYEGDDPNDQENEISSRTRNRSQGRDPKVDSIGEDVDDFIHVMDNQIEATQPSSIQSGAPSVDPSSKMQLKGIPEEIPSYKSHSISIPTIVTNNDNTTLGVNERSYMNLELDNMSLSNFRMVHGSDNVDQKDGKLGIKNDSPYGSVINMKEINSDSHVQTGRNYRKSSTFLISPKVSVCGHPDYIMYNTGDEKYGIKLLNNSNVPELFIEFDSLKYNQTNNNYYWVENARWLRYEEYYNPDLRRFDSPHLSPLSVRGISKFRRLFSKGEVVLDCHQSKFSDVLRNISDSVTKAGTFNPKEIEDIRNALILRHYHAGEVLSNSASDNAIFSFDKETQSVQPQTNPSSSRQRSISSFVRFDVNQRRPSQARLDGKLDPGTEAMSVQVGALESLEHTFSLFVRLDPPIKVEGLNEVNCPLRFIFIIFGPKSKENELYEIGRVFAVMMSNLEFREIGYSASKKEDLIEATKNFVSHSVIVPLTKVITHDTLAGMLPQMKIYAALFLAEQNQKAFNQIKNDITNKDQEVTMNQFEDGVRRRVSFNLQMLTDSNLANLKDTRKSTLLELSEGSTDKKTMGARRFFTQFCPPFHHIIMDLKGLKSRYLDDYRDAFKSDHVSTVFIGMIFIYFVVLSPAITFGALLNAVNPKMTVSLMLVASGFYQFMYTLLSGQPLEVVGITGPVFVVEKVLGSLAKGFHIELEIMRFWIGIYVSMLGLVFTIFNGVIIIKHFRRSVEEVYNFLVAAIFILSAFFSMFKALPYKMTPLAPNGTNIDVIEKERLKFGVGGSTLFLAFFMANFCVMLVKIKRGSFFRRQIRNLLGSFNVPLGIILIVAMERIFFHAYKLPTLNVPPSNVINLSLWVNTPVFANLGKATTEAHGFCFLISLSLFAILLTEVSTNSISTTKTERRLVKPSLYSLNYFFIIVLFPIISGITGWPFVSGAMVRSNAHCLAMSKWSLNLPGVPSKVIGAVEQRVSGVLVGLLVFLSVFLGSALRYIPMAAMYGMFLYMGIMGASDLVFMRRLISLLQRRKYWGAEDYLKGNPTWNISILILIQAFFIGILITLNCISEFTPYSWATLIFPLFVGLYATLRGYAMPRWPRLNSHLSKMDKKHPVKLFADQQISDQVLLTVDEKGVNVKVVQSNSVDALAMEKDDLSFNDNESELDKYW